MNTPWGNQRAELLLRGIPLPSFGSVRDRVLRVMVQRERDTFLMEKELTLIGMGIFAGVPKDQASNAARFLREELANYINHRMFSARFQVSRLRRQRESIVTDLQMLERLKSYG